MYDGLSTRYDLSYDFDAGVCDRINTRTNVRFQISPSTNEQKMWHQHSLSYVRMRIVYDKSYVSCRLDLRPVSTQENKRRIGSDWTLFHLVLSTPLNEKS